VKNVSPDEIDSKQIVESLGKGLRVLECFSEERPRLTATEAAKMAGLTRTAAKRYLMSLVHYGYAQTDGKYFWLLPRVLKIGLGYLESTRLPRLVQPFLQRFSVETGETANFSILDSHDVVYLYRSNSPRILSIGFHTGARVSAHCSSAGHAMLSKLGDAEFESWTLGHDFFRLTAQTITDREVFKSVINEVKQLGYSLVDQYANVGLSGLAVPLVTRRGECVGAISTTFQNINYPEQSCLKQLLPKLQQTADLMRDIV
jgi:IclR family pca regulon transcriptional regulator